MKEREGMLSKPFYKVSVTLISKQDKDTTKKRIIEQSF
jgi:hypothetical protein